jgi:flagellar basal-body rod modification protein FlgD
MFLKLMVTQMRNQDPMNPTDSSQFLAQTAQFTALEKMEDVANQTAQMVSTQMAFGASSLVGRAVTYLDANGATVPGTVKGVNFGANGPELDVDGVPVLLAAVQSVTSGTTGTTPTQGTGTTPGTTPGTATDSTPGATSGAGTDPAS